MFYPTRKALLMAAAIMPLIAASALAADRFIVMAFDGVAAEADVSAYNTCIDTSLAKTALGGSAQRFVLNEVQMFGGVTVKLPEYLTLFEVTAANAASAARLAAEAVSVSDKPCAGADPAKALRYVYHASGATMKRVHPDPATAADRGPRQHYAHIVFTVPNDAVKDQFEEWYFSCHMPEILERTGLVSGQRGIDGTGTGGVLPTGTMGLYRIELPQTLTIAATRPGPRAPGARNCETSRMMNGDLSRGYTYRAIGPIVTSKE